MTVAARSAGVRAFRAGVLGFAALLLPWGGSLLAEDGGPKKGDERETERERSESAATDWTARADKADAKGVIPAKCPPSVRREST
jgi:hypothetical protein